MKIFSAFLLSLLFVANVAFAAISSTAVWEVRSTATGGANVNGGCYNGAGSSPGTDWTLQNGAQYSPSGTLTSSGAGAVILYAAAAADMNRNCIKITGGTNFTTGWYEITSVVVGVSITVDRNATTGVGASGSGNIGGAISLTSSDDAVFEAMFNAGNTIWIKGGTNISYTLGGAVSIAAAGTLAAPVIVNGYASTRGDNPLLATRPTLDAGANVFTTGAFQNWGYLQFTGTATNVLLIGGASNFVSYVKVTNTSTTAARAALSINSSSLDSVIYGSEAWSIRGTAYSAATTSNRVSLFGNYFHDSDKCITDGSTTIAGYYVNNIIEGCVTYGFSATGAKTSAAFIYGNTFYGSENKDMGTAIDFATGATNGPRIYNNIIYGWTKGINSTDSLTGEVTENWNQISNTTTPRTNIGTGANSISTTPLFKNATQVTVSTATTSGSTFTKSGATFSTSGVTAGRDFLYISNGGAGATVGKYTIASVDSNTQLTLGQAPGNSTGDITASITVGHNFAPDQTVRNKGFPGVFPAGITVSYPNVGAVQSMPGVGPKGH